MRRTSTMSRLRLAVSRLIRRPADGLVPTSVARPGAEERREGRPHGRRGGPAQGFRAERSGNVAIITALAALPMFGLVGFAIDYGVAMSDKAKLDGAADAASMAGLTTMQIVLKGGGSAGSAVQQGVTQVQAQSGASGAIKIGLYTMSGYPLSGSRLTTISAPTSDFPTLMTLASTIDLGANDGNVGFGDSDFINSLTSLNGILPSQGNGASPTTPIDYVVLITDGVQDTPGNCSGGHRTAVLPINECYPLQARAKVGVINTVYNPIHANNDQSAGFDGRYVAMVLPIAGGVSPALQACVTSPTLYHEATDGPAIASSLSKLFASTTAAARFAQ